MKISFGDLKPSPAEFFLKSKTRKLRPFDLDMQVLVADLFKDKGNDPFQFLAEQAKERKREPIYRVVWELLEDKSDFPSHFQLMAAAKSPAIHQKILEALEKTIGLSQPVKKKILEKEKKKREKHNIKLQKIIAKLKKKRKKKKFVGLNFLTSSLKDILGI